MSKKIAFLSLIAVFVLLSGFGCKTSNPQTQKAMEPITLTYWRVFDGPDAFQDIINQYKAIHPNITIKYRKLRYDEYESELLNALAEDRGPDILSIHNTWIRKYQSKLAPLPDSITMAYASGQSSNNLQNTTQYQLKTTKSLTPTDIKNKFVDVVYHDVVLDDGKIYGLPLSVDTLALYYNRDLLNNAGIVQAPQYWNKEFQEDVKKLTKLDNQQNILQSGISLGGSDNIERFSDILSALMMQNGANMMDGKKVTFNTIPAAAQDSGYNPGLEALRFYLDFSNPGKEVYSWNKDMSDDLDLFISGKLAMMFGYAYHLPMIKAGAPKLNLGIAPLPQIEGSPNIVNFANYWVEAVSKKSAHPNEAWDFVEFETQAEQAKSYLEKTQKPTALRSLISSQTDDANLGVFANELLTSKSWYVGQDPQAAEKAIGEMIDSGHNNPDKLLEIINTGAAKVQQTIN